MIARNMIEWVHVGILEIMVLCFYAATKLFIYGMGQR